MYKENNKNTF